METQYETDVNIYLSYLDFIEYSRNTSNLDIVALAPLDEISRDKRIINKLDEIYSRPRIDPIICGNNMPSGPLNLPVYGNISENAGMVSTPPILPSPLVGMGLTMGCLPHDVATVPSSGSIPVGSGTRDVVGQLNNSDNKGLQSVVKEVTNGGGLMNGGGNHFVQGLATDTSLKMANNIFFNACPVQPPATVGANMANVSVNGQDSPNFDPHHIRVNSLFNFSGPGINREHYPNYKEEVHDNDHHGHHDGHKHGHGHGHHRHNIFHQLSKLHPNFSPIPLTAEYNNPNSISKGVTLDEKQSAKDGVMSLGGSHKVIDDYNVNKANSNYQTSVKYYDNNAEFNMAMNAFAATLAHNPVISKELRLRWWHRHNKLKGF